MSGRSETTGRDIAELLGGELAGPSRDVQRLADPSDATIDAVVVLSGPADLDRLADRSVGVLVGPRDLAPGDRPYVAVDAPRLALARLTAWFDRRPRPAGISSSAAIDPDAHLGEGVAVGPGAVVHAGARIGDRTAIGAGCVIGAGSRVGIDCRLHASVTLYDGVAIGDRVILHSGAVLGADGFGYAGGARGAVKIHHLGGVRIGDDVEIGANTCIDRGTLGDTTVGDRTKIDNLCQVAHNVSIGPDTLIAGMTGIGGSAVIGRGVTLAGRVSVADHVTIGDGATLGGGSGVHKDIPAGETWMGPMAVPYRQFVRLRYLQGKLEDIWAFVKDRS